MLRKLGAYSYKQITESLQILKIIEAEGATLNDLSRHKLDMEKAMREGKSASIRRPCPKCEKNLNYSDIGSRSKKFKTGYRTYWLCGASCCTDKGCGYEEWSKLTIDEWKTKLSEKEVS